MDFRTVLLAWEDLPATSQELAHLTSSVQLGTFASGGRTALHRTLVMMQMCALEGISVLKVSLNTRISAI